MWRVKNSCGSRQFIVINGYNDRLHQQSINSFSVGLGPFFRMLGFSFLFYYFSAFDKSQSHMMGSSKDTTTKFSFSSVGYCKC